MDNALTLDKTILVSTEPHCFALYANCEVSYSGRASSTLARGNFLILYKQDRSLSIHASTMIMPRNYLAAGTLVQVAGNQLVFSRNKEIVKVLVHHVHSLTPFECWSDAKVDICRTEKELARKIYNNWDDYFNADFVWLHLEYGTPLGPIDILGQTLVADYVVEVKRRVVSIKDISQLRRYVETFETSGREVYGYLAAPAIGRRALEYLKKHSLEFIHVDFD